MTGAVAPWDAAIGIETRDLRLGVTGTTCAGPPDRDPRRAARVATIAGSPGICVVVALDPVVIRKGATGFAAPAQAVMAWMASGRKNHAGSSFLGMKLAVRSLSAYRVRAVRREAGCRGRNKG
jgi:hypothetical protein